MEYAQAGRFADIMSGRPAFDAAAEQRRALRHGLLHAEMQRVGQNKEPEQIIAAVKEYVAFMSAEAP